jgi:hypothetical protein
MRYWNNKLQYIIFTFQNSSQSGEHFIVEHTSCNNRMVNFNTPFSHSQKSSQSGEHFIVKHASCDDRMVNFNIPFSHSQKSSQSGEHFIVKKVRKKLGKKKKVPETRKASCLELPLSLSFGLLLLLNAHYAILE